MPPSPPYHIEFVDRQAMPVDIESLKKAIEVALNFAECKAAVISVALVTDPEIHQINRQFLNHDYPTDVISFPMASRDDGRDIEGEIVASTDTAESSAKQYEWTFQEELSLYLIHGTLHLTGLDDKQPEHAKQMRAAESECLRQLGFEHRF